MIKIIFFIIVGTLWHGCSSGSKERALKVPRLLDESAPILKEQVERNEALIRYKHMRARSEGIPQKIRYHYYGKDFVRMKRKKIVKDPESIMMEISQNIDYYCILQDGKNKFINTEDCKTKGMGVWKRCKLDETFAEAANENFDEVSCVKKGLKEL